MASNCGHSRNTLCGLLLAIVAGGATTPVMAFQDEGTVRVGVLESLTGTYAPFGLANMSGTVIAFDEINAAGGVNIDGKKVKIAVTPSPNGYDAGVDPAQSVTLLKRLLLDDKVLLIKGLSNSNAGTAVFNYLAELEKEMFEAAEKMEFERAAALRDRITQYRDQLGKKTTEVAVDRYQPQGNKRKKRSGNAALGAKVPRPKR